MIVALIFLGCIAIIYIAKYYLMIKNLKDAEIELKEIKQNSEENRILHCSSPDKSVEQLLMTMNEYILQSRELQISKEQKEQNLRAQIENISHDLRTPLTSILGYLDFIDENALSIDDRENMEIVKRKSCYLQRLVGDFYDLSRLELNDYQINMESFDINRFSKEIFLSHFQEFANKQLQVTIQIDEKPLFVNADSNAMERIFINMVQNVLRYAQTKFFFSIIQDNNGIHIVFENDTSSMKEEDVANLFERFYVNENARTQQSTGLGLTINKLLIEAMGGSVEAKLKNNCLRIAYHLNKSEHL